jgi:hypothetical protein
MKFAKGAAIVSKIDNIALQLTVVPVILAAKSNQPSQTCQGIPLKLFSY